MILKFLGASIFRARVASSASNHYRTYIGIDEINVNKIHQRNRLWNEERLDWREVMAKKYDKLPKNEYLDYYSNIDDLSKYIPPPREKIENVRGFLEAIGHNCIEYNDKFPDWDSLFKLTLEKATKELEIDIKRARLITAFARKYRNGESLYSAGPRKERLRGKNKVGYNMRVKTNQLFRFCKSSNYYLDSEKKCIYNKIATSNTPSVN